MVHHLLVLVANVLIPIAVLVFSLGFFPYKPLISGLATFDSFEDRPPRVFDKVIFMVVDALRSDFVYSNNSGFLFTQSPTDFRSLIRSGAAIPFTAYAGSPTVTMPRLKAMTTGSVPSFLDVILNIAESDTSSTLAYQDTWLAQIRAKGEQLVMYGDDTWLKLFPGMFSRSDGTTSFFVSDFTEVDTNVTRHIHDELVTGDWSGMIMHYLGLDHIGHKAGPQSSYMVPKQHEMDSIVAQVYRAMEQEAHLQSTLFILCGDHGMNDAGNHGGSSAGETSPALTFISPKLQSLGAGRESPVNATHELQYYSVVDQTDITPTLAGLLGLPIPLNSLGVFIPEFLNMWHLGSQRIRLLAGNAKQLLNALKETYPNHNFGDDTLPASCYDDSPRGPDGALCAWAQAQELLHQYGADAADDIYVQTEIESALLRFLRSSQEVMSSAASNYDLRYLLLGICIAGLAVLFSIPATYKALSNHTLPRLFLTTGVLLYGAMMFASSYVEEEQQFWYWVFTGWTFYLHVRSIRLQKAPQGATYLLPAAILAISHRFMRRWNQTGQKFAAEPDIARIYLPSHRINLWLLIVVTYADVCLHLMDNLSSLIWRLLCLAVTAMCFTFKLVFAASESPELLNETTIQTVATFMDGITLVLYARVAMGGIAVLFMLIFMRNGKLPIKQGLFHEALTLFLLTQSRVTNVPIFLFFRLQLKALTWMNLNSAEVTLTSLLMQYIAFFAFGGSNAISSIDLSNAYNGVSVYNVILVGILTYVGNWAGPIWWISATKLLRRGESHDESRTHTALLTFHAASILTSVMAACTALRTHLFIWTVFSPKYLYTMSWVIIHHWVNLLLPTVGRQ
ncbi:mannose-ethanolamine phosphotransferase LAS21 [Aspergillus nidulans FGSC A4]|uniref:GPI ethanolamine phosphate transferase 2 n=1 Tax=Emericella nidulans (strain FGSC A4 / ATCC 38163 / CBS 112.46 / NRRL 194 / M139) TaxID=227321 RepID=C8V0B9_EMENI|nr:mannose-ethanolamine phosphotransferase LAS21 [Aspergillus nidulans FGSC A4]CBF70850.1 TPA: transferase (Gpi7), putative (AFU_orthologue; AFUA_6G05260) [Aspergillus nidulans FGSC A4]